MKVEKVTLHYTEKRSERYQTAEHGIAIEVSLNEGESVNHVLAKYQEALVSKVTALTAKEIERLIEESGK